MANISAISDVPGGIDLEVTVTFLPGSEVTTVAGGTPTAWVKHPNGTMTAATTYSLTAPDKIRAKWPFDTLPGARYWCEVYLTPPAGTPHRVAKGYIEVSDYLG